MNFWRTLLAGFRSIGEGMSTFTLFPPKRAKLVPKSRMSDAENIRSDWEKVIGKWSK
jgi:hypothetical protein